MRRASLALILLTCSGCRTMGPTVLTPSPTGFLVMNQPAVRFFGEGRSVMLLEPLVVKFGETGDSLVVPAGSISDFASIPGILQSMVNKLGPYNLPAIVHDYLYATQICSRRQADGIFFRMLRDVGTPAGTRRAMFIAVVNFGGAYWERNARLRAEGSIRVAPQQAREPWTYETRAQFQSYLQTLGVPGDSEPVISPGFCTCTKPTRPGRRGRNHPSHPGIPSPRPVYVLPHG